LTLDPTIRHTVVHHSSTSTYIPNFIEIEETFCGRTDVRTDIFPLSNIIRSTFGSRPNNNTNIYFFKYLKSSRSAFLSGSPPKSHRLLLVGRHIALKIIKIVDNLSNYPANSQRQNIMAAAMTLKPVSALCDDASHICQVSPLA